MGGLQAARRSVQQKTVDGIDVSHRKKADPRVGTPLDPNVSFEIEIVTGGTTMDGELSHRILWRGSHEYADWWQELPDGIDVSGEEYTGFLVRVLKLEQAPIMSAGDAPRGGVRSVAVLGAHIDDGGLRLCHEPDGTPHHIDLKANLFDGEAMDWLMEVDSTHTILTDIILGDLWQSDSMLESARVAWDHGTFLPSLKDAMDVLRSASPIIQAQQLSAEARQAMVEIALFMVQPIEHQRMLIRGHSETLRHSFVSGGLIYDCLTCLQALEPRHVKEMAIEAGKYKASNPGGALFDAAQAQGKI